MGQDLTLAGLKILDRKYATFFLNFGLDVRAVKILKLRRKLWCENFRQKMCWAMIFRLVQGSNTLQKISFTLEEAEVSALN